MAHTRFSNLPPNSLFTPLTFIAQSLENILKCLLSFYFVYDGWWIGDEGTPDDFFAVVALPLLSSLKAAATMLIAICCALHRSGSFAFASSTKFRAVPSAVIISRGMKKRCNNFPINQLSRAIHLHHPRSHDVTPLAWKIHDKWLLRSDIAISAFPSNFPSSLDPTLIRR